MAENGQESQNQDRRDRIKELQITGWGLAGALAAGLLSVGLYYFIGPKDPKCSASHGAFASLLWSLAWLAGAFIFGFIFGVPKVPQKNAAAPPQQPVPSQSAQDAQKDDVSHRKDPALRVNTNLEEISDWLTKILVGATLTQLTKIPPKIVLTANYMSASMCAPSAFSAAIIIYFSALGFFSGYVVTRMFFALAFTRADRGAELSPEQSKFRSSADAALLTNTTVSPEPNAHVDEAILKAARKAQSVPVTNALSSDLISALVRAAILTGDPKRALSAAELAVNKNATDAKAHLDYATALEKSGQSTEAVLRELETARRLITPETDWQTKEGIYNSLVYFSLYMPKPQGFTAAIQYAKEFLANNTPSRASLWINLACGFGQKYAWLKANNGSQEEMNQTRNEALNAIQQALASSPGSKRRLNELLHGSGTDPQDNDLQPFEKDQQFLDLLG